MVGYRRTTRDDDGSTFAALVIGGLAIAPLVLLFTVVPAWVLMLALGAAHDHWPAIPALGYWTTFILLAGAGVAFSPFRKVAA